MPTEYEEELNNKALKLSKEIHSFLVKKGDVETDVALAAVAILFVGSAKVLGIEKEKIHILVDYYYTILNPER